MELFVKSSPITEKYLDSFRDLMSVANAHGGNKEGDLCYVGGCYSMDALQQFVKSKGVTTGQLFNSFTTKQRNLVQLTKGKNNGLEIGFNMGNSALIMLLYNPEFRLTIVDICYWPYTIPCFQHLRQKFGDRITMHSGDSRNVLPTLVKQEFDFIHIDGSHDIGIARSDLIHSHRLLLEGGTLLFDDTDYKPLDDLVSEFTQPRYDPIPLESNPPLANKAFTKKIHPPSIQPRFDREILVGFNKEKILEVGYQIRDSVWSTLVKGTNLTIVTNKTDMKELNGTTILQGDILGILKSMKKRFDLIHIHDLSYDIQDVLPSIGHLFEMDGILLVDNPSQGDISSIIDKYTRNNYSIKRLESTQPFKVFCRHQLDFNSVYLKQRWTSAGEGSGPGSSIDYTRPLVSFLKQIIVSRNIQSIADVSCGGMLWWPLVLREFPTVSFYGFDISSVVIERNVQRFPEEQYHFEARNAVVDTFPKVDLIICRHTMMHLSLLDGKKILDNLYRSGSKYIGLTSHTSLVKNEDPTIKLLQDADTGFDWRMLNMELEPFNCKHPIEFTLETGGSLNIGEIFALYENTL